MTAIRCDNCHRQIAPVDDVPEIATGMNDGMAVLAVPFPTLAGEQIENPRRRREGQQFPNAFAVEPDRGTAADGR